MNIEEIEFTSEPDEVDVDLHCEPTEHEIINAGDDDSPYYFCVKCGFSGNAYIVQSFATEAYL